MRRSVQVMLLSSVILLMGAAVLSWQVLSAGTMSQASGASVLGPPTLPAATVNTILASTPMAGTGSVVEQAARQMNIDDAFALAVWYVETNQGAAGVGSGDHNPGGVRASQGYPTDAGGYTIYPSYAAAIQDWFSIVSQRYIARGLTTVYTIAGPYVGTSSSGLWAGKVMRLMSIYRSEAPPTPTPTPSTLKYKIATTLKGTQTQQSTRDARQESAPALPSVPTGTGQTPQSAVTARPSAGQGPIVALGLAGALLLALGALWIRRRTTPVPAVVAAPASVLAQREPVTDALAFTPLLSAAGPGAAAFPASGDQAPAGRDTDTLSFFPGLSAGFSTGFSAAPVLTPDSLPVQLPFSEPALTVPVSPPASVPAAPPLRRLILAPGPQGAPLSAASAAAGEDEVHPAVVPALMRGGGLLSRYRRRE